MVVCTLFDFNGVLVDDEHVHLAAFRDVLTPMGVELTEKAYVERYLGYDDIGAFRAVLSDAGLTPTDAQITALVEAKRPCYRARAEKDLVIFEGAPDLIRACASMGPVAIVSGALRDEIAFALERMGVDREIAFVVSAEDTRRGKPDPDGYERAIKRFERRLGFSSWRGVVVEDSLAGIEAAKTAGLMCCAVAHTYAADALAAAGADSVVPHLRDLRAEALADLALRGRSVRASGSGQVV